jgi:hypothetical protein
MADLGHASSDFAETTGGMGIAQLLHAYFQVYLEREIFFD